MNASVEKVRRARPGESLALVFASRAMADVVTYFVLHPDGTPHFRALQRITGVSSRSLQHELTRLRKLGMIERVEEGRLVRYRATAGHPRWSLFRSILREFGEPVHILRMAVRAVPGVEAAFIFGSCARGEMDADSDIDLFVLGETLEEPEPELALATGSLEASMLLRHEVNVTRFSRAKLSARKGGGFLRSVLTGPKQWLVGTEGVLNVAAGG